jgi:HPt (histidine-containing phosphotransfer) domain-containing protein
MILQEVMDGFVEQVDAQVIRIRQALDDGDAALVGRETHSIKGGAANLNARRLSEYAAVMESFGKANNLRGLRETLPDLEAAFEALRRFVASARTDSGATHKAE